MDTYSMQRGHAVPEIVTGKPISIGGSVFRHEATGAGATYREVGEALGVSADAVDFAIQGRGQPARDGG